MAIRVGGVVAIKIGDELPRAGIVLRQREGAVGHAEPLLDIMVAWLSADGLSADVGRVNDVPHAEDSPTNHYQWTYGGPEVLVRRATPEPVLLSAEYPPPLGQLPGLTRSLPGAPDQLPEPSPPWSSIGPPEPSA